MAPRSDRPLSNAERRALDAIEAGFARERQLRRRRWWIVLLVVVTTALATVAVIAPVAAVTLCLAIAVAFAGPLVITLFWRSVQTND
jgi:drug/metabolite transporter (DMT)-like permease